MRGEAMVWDRQDEGQEHNEMVDGKGSSAMSNEGYEEVEVDKEENVEVVESDKDLLQEEAKKRNEKAKNRWYCVWVSDAPMSQLVMVANLVDGGGKVEVWKPYIVKQDIKKKNIKMYLYEGYCFIRCTEEEAIEFQRRNNAGKLKVIMVLRKMDGVKPSPLTEEEVEQIKIVEGTYTMADKFGISVGDICSINSGILAEVKVKVKEIRDMDVYIEFDAFGRHQKLWVNIKELSKI